MLPINLSLVAAGAGISILPNSVQTIQRQGVVYRPLQDAPIARQIAIVWQRSVLQIYQYRLLPIQFYCASFLQLYRRSLIGKPAITW
jgi:DNA-binding transcriptional LysR family regulator